MVTETSDATFQKDVLESDLPIVVDFWAPWCGPCRIVGPVIDHLSQKAGNKAKIYKLNVDDNPATAAKYGIAGIPTVIFFQKGKVVQEFIGVQPEQVYSNALSVL